MRDLYDIHCHILPGVDDGAKDMDMALSMIEKEIDAGVETIIFEKKCLNLIWKIFGARMIRLLMKQEIGISVCIWAVNFMPIWRW